MNKYRFIIWSFFSGFFFIFGLLQFLFFIRKVFPQFSAVGGELFQTLLCIGAAVLLSAFYTLISVDGHESEYATKARLLICGIPSVLICGVLSVYYGLPSLILGLFGIADRSKGIVVWIIGFILSCAAFVVAFYLLEKHYCRLGREYDIALDAYKKATTTVCLHESED